MACACCACADILWEREKEKEIEKEIERDIERKK